MPLAIAIRQRRKLTDASAVITPSHFPAKRAKNLCVINTGLQAGDQQQASSEALEVLAHRFESRC